MSFLFLTRRLAFSIAVAIPVIALAQFAPLNGEYPIAGTLPASQTHPHASINSGGGYVVWQDQNTFGASWTVMARPLNIALNYTLPPFRVNSSAVGDHESARVALLKDGGAVFVWLGGQFASPVPEPSVNVLFFAGLAGLRIRRRRRAPLSRVSAVPEPASLSIFALAALALGRRKRAI